MNAPIENVVQLFITVAEIANRGSGAGGGQDEFYWKRSLTQLLRNAVDLLVLRLLVGERTRLSP